MKLYNFDRSPNPLKVRIALAELGLDYENEEIALFKGEQRSPEFRNVNPLGKVPVLVEGDLVLRESNAILCYLGREHGLWPKLLAEEARAVQWLFFEAVHLTGPCGTLWFNSFAMEKVGAKPRPADELKSEVNDAEWALGHLDAHLKDRDFMLQDGFSLVDCAIGVQMVCLEEAMVRQGCPWPNVFAYKERFKSRPSWGAARGDALWGK